MKILHLSSEYPPQNVYGLGRFVSELAKAQAARGDEVYVLTNSIGGRDADVVVESVRVCRIEFPPPPRPPTSSAQLAQFNVLLLERAVGLGRELSDADVLNAHDWLAAPAACALKRLWGRSLVVTMHDCVIGKHFGKLGAEQKYIAEMENWVCLQSDHLIAVSSFVAEELQQYYHVPVEKVSVIHGAVNPAGFALPNPDQLHYFRELFAQPEEKVVLMVGRLDPEKGCQVLMNAVPPVVSRRPDVRFVLAGSGQMEESLRRHVRDNGLERNVFLTGYLDQVVLKYLYRSADCLVIPSLYEPFGIVALEGMACETPVIASRVGGLQEIVVDGETGLLVRPDDSGELSEAILLVLSDPMLGQKLARAGLNSLSARFSWRQAAQKTFECYAHESRLPAAGVG
jgi:glycosyltransferase involved in cell wall biosynthesis